MRSAPKHAIGIFGGTFAPIHNGHLQLALTARDRLGLSQVRLLPAPQPPLRHRPAIAAQRRLEWVRLAIKGHPKLVADGRELKRTGMSYTIDTLAELRDEFPATPLCLLLGSLIFCGSLLVLALSGTTWLGAVTPIGGALMIVGFVLSALDVRQPA